MTEKHVNALGKQEFLHSINKFRILPKINRPFVRLLSYCNTNGHIDKLQEEFSIASTFVIPKTQFKY